MQMGEDKGLPTFKTGAADGASMEFSYNNAFGEPLAISNAVKFPMSESIQMSLASGSAVNKNYGATFIYVVNHDTGAGDLGINAGAQNEIFRIGKIADTEGDFDNNAALANRIFHYGISGSSAFTASFGKLLVNGTDVAGGGGSMNNFIISDGSTTQTIEDGNTITFNNVANETTVAVSATDTVTIGLPDDVTIAGELTTGNGAEATPAIAIGSANDGFFHSSGIKVITNNSVDFVFQDDGDFHADGDVIAFSSTVSDERLKDNIKTIKFGLEKIKNLRGVEYVWNDGGRKGHKDFGVIAQEVEKVIPEIVREKQMLLMDDEIYKTVDYEKLTVVLIEAVKEQQEQIEELKKEVEEIKNGSSK
tara:strand:- start:192 stop:1280 length:1089 start_codon:yes stop_codon:yes gene_type:complete